MSNSGPPVCNHFPVWLKTAAVNLRTCFNPHLKARPPTRQRLMTTLFYLPNATPVYFRFFPSPYLAGALCVSNHESESLRLAEDILNWSSERSKYASERRNERMKRTNLWAVA